MTEKEDNPQISSLTNLCNEIRQEYNMEYSFCEEEKQSIIANKPLLLTLNKDSTKCYKIFYDEFTNNICDIISEKIGKNIDVRIRKHIFIQLVSRNDIQNTKSIEKAFYEYFEKYDVKLYEKTKQKIVCKIITCKGGIYLRQTVELDSPVAKYSEIAKKGILTHRTKFFSDCSVKLPIYVNGENKSVIRCHVVNIDGDELGWTSETNLKGELLCKEIPSAHTVSFKFIYAENHIPDDVDYEEFKENIASELGLTSLKEEILERGFIDLSNISGIVSVKKIVKCYERIMREERETMQLAQIQEQEEAEESRKEMLKNLISGTVVAASTFAMYKLQQRNAGTMKNSISRKAVSTGLRHLAQANTGLRSVIVDEVASYLEDHEEGDLDILSMNGMIGKVGMNCLQKMGLGDIAGQMNGSFNEENQQDFQTDEKNDNEPHVEKDEQNEQHINQVDNLLDLFKEKEEQTKKNIDMKIDL